VAFCQISSSPDGKPRRRKAPVFLCGGKATHRKTGLPPRLSCGTRTKLPSRQNNRFQIIFNRIGDGKVSFGSSVARVLSRKGFVSIPGDTAPSHSGSSFMSVKCKTTDSTCQNPPFYSNNRRKSRDAGRNGRLASRKPQRATMARFATRFSISHLSTKPLPCDSAQQRMCRFKRPGRFRSHSQWWAWMLLFIHPPHIENPAGGPHRTLSFPSRTRPRVVKVRSVVARWR